MCGKVTSQNVDGIKINPDQVGTGYDFIIVYEEKYIYYNLQFIN